MRCCFCYQKELGVTWDVDLYGELLKIGGGKERYESSTYMATSHSKTNNDSTFDRIAGSVEN